jgi:hypothetical protein
VQWQTQTSFGLTSASQLRYPQRHRPSTFICTAFRVSTSKLIGIGKMTSFSLPIFPVEGGCVCGAVRYGVHAAPLSVYACHCKDCQRFSGGPFSVAITVRLTDFSLDRGEPARLAKPADSGRVVGVRFCRNCGTRLWHEPAHSPHLVNIAAGTLDDCSWAQPAAHVWESRKASWISFTNPSFFSCDGQPQDREPLYMAWEMTRD